MKNNKNQKLQNIPSTSRFEMTLFAVFGIAALISGTLMVYGESYRPLGFVCIIAGILLSSGFFVLLYATKKGDITLR